ncbi:hypothetical protein CXB51_010216 [Gossypium anomalum]|uniref:DUF4283 domain-containing protein n=1 Tax=Gossypium anomalum TaxID=47600 RepID=A0A8J6D6G6_9ROSI|nr:hypothetical protein CXB51_010216 [Gossypium anomalum]
MMRTLDKRAMVDLITTLWNCWNSRNNFMIRGKDDKAQSIWDRASNLNKDFHIFNILNEPLLSQNVIIKKWEKPPKGFVKINFDPTVEVKKMGMVLFETNHAGLMNKMRKLGTDVTIVGARTKECKQAFSNFKVFRSLVVALELLARIVIHHPFLGAILGARTAKDINKLLEKLNFSEEEATKVISTKLGSINSQGFEAWAIRKIMSIEKVNREAMYWMFKSLWFTKEEVNFVALKEGVFLVKLGNVEDRKRILNLSPWLFDQFLFAMLPYVKEQEVESYAFNLTPFWGRIFSIPLEYMDTQVAMDVGSAIEEVIATGWHDREGGWTEYFRLRVIIDIFKPLRRVV